MPHPDAAPFRWSSGTWPAHVIIFMSGREHGAVDGTGYRQRRPVFRLLYLQRSLTAASSLDDMLSAFTAGRAISAWQVRVCACFGSLALRCAVEPHSSGIKPSVFEPLRIQRLGQEQHYLGPLTDQSCWWCYRKRKRWDRWLCDAGKRC